MDEKEKYYQAKKQVQEIKGFYTHLATYILVNAFLFVLNVMYSPYSWWFYWPLFGWGIGLAFHAFGVFGRNMFFGKDWEEKKIKEIMEKEDGKL